MWMLGLCGAPSWLLGLCGVCWAGHRAGCWAGHRAGCWCGAPSWMLGGAPSCWCGAPSWMLVRGTELCWGFSLVMLGKHSMLGKHVSLARQNRGGFPCLADQACSLVCSGPKQRAAYFLSPLSAKLGAYDMLAMGKHISLFVLGKHIFLVVARPDLTHESRVHAASMDART